MYIYIYAYIIIIIYVYIYIYIPSNSKFLTHYLPGKTYSWLVKSHHLFRIPLDPYAGYPSPSKHSPAISCASLWKKCSPASLRSLSRPLPAAPRPGNRSRTSCSILRPPSTGRWSAHLDPARTSGHSGGRHRTACRGPGEHGGRKIQKKGGTGRCSKKF